MDPIDIEVIATPDLRDPVLIEGLPGVGHVGKLAAEHLVEELESELVRRVYSTYFPPQVTVSEGGIAELVSVEFHVVETETRDLLVLTGDHQAQSIDGHYQLADTVLDIADEFGIETVYALGGVPTGEIVEEYGVLGAVGAESQIDALEAVGVEFRDDEPAGGIVGVSGLLLGLGARRGFEVACLMGETSGYLVDPKSAQAVLETLSELLEFDVEYSDLEDRASEMEEVMSQLQEMEQQQMMDLPSDEDLRYIG